MGSICPVNTVSCSLLQLLFETTAAQQVMGHRSASGEAARLLPDPARKWAGAGEHSSPQGRGARGSPLPALPGRHTRALTSLGEHKTLGHVMGFCCPDAGPRAMGFWGLQTGDEGSTGPQAGQGHIRCY